MSLVLVYEEVVSGDVRHRVIRSTDNGATWVEGNSFMNPGGGATGKAFVTQSGHLILSEQSLDLFSTWYEYAVLTRTTDDGATWASAVPPSLLSAGEQWEMHDGVALANNWVLAVGFLTSGHGTFVHQLLISTDGGETFEFVGASLGLGPGGDERTALSCDVSNGVLVIGARDFGGDPVIFRSVDDGLTVAEISLPTANFTPGNGYEITAVRALPSGRFLAGGYAPNDLGGASTRLWRSDVGGSVWTEVTDTISDLPADGDGAIRDIAVLSNGRAVIAMDTDTGATSGWFRLSDIDGTTFTVEGTYDEAVTPRTACSQMTVADDGSFVACIQITVAQTEVWRGVPSADYSDIAWSRVHVINASGDVTGGCGIASVANVVSELLAAPEVARRPDFCTSITGSGCETPVPTDPALVLSDSVDGPGGFLSVLFLLGLGSVPEVVPAVLTRPTGCVPLVPAYCVGPDS